MAPINQFIFNVEEQINEMVQNVFGDFIESGNGRIPMKTTFVTSRKLTKKLSNHIGCLRWCVVDSGDAPSVGSQPAESTATTEDGPLDDAVQDVDEEDNAG